MLITSAFLSKSLYHNNDTSAISDIKATEGIALSFKEVWKRSGLTMMASGAVAALTVITAIVGAVKQYYRELDQNTSNAMQSWSQSNANLETQISEITRLKTALDEGSLSEQEAYNAKSQLYDIQNQLANSYGDQAQGIDLVNGKLEDQTNLIRENIAAQEASTVLNENKKGNDRAIKRMEAIREYELGSINTLNIGKEQSDAIQKILDKYGDSIKTKFADDGFTETIYFEGNADDAYEVINDFMNDVRGLSKDLGSSTTESILNTSSKSLNSAKDILSTYKETYEEAKRAQLVADDNYYKPLGRLLDNGKIQSNIYKDVKKQSAAEWMNDAVNAVEAYNKALALGDTSKINEAAAAFEEVKGNINYLLTYGGMGQHSSIFNDIFDQVNKRIESQYKLEEELATGSAKKHAEILKASGLTALDLKQAFDTEGLQDGETQLNAIIDLADKLGYISKDSAEDVYRLIDSLAEWGYVAGGSISGAAKSVSAWRTSVKTAIETQNNLTAALAAGNSATGMSSEQMQTVIDAFKEIEGFDMVALFEDTATGVQMNTKAFKEYNKQLQQKEQIELMDAIIEKTKEYNSELSKPNNAENIKKTKEELSRLNMMLVEYEAATSKYNAYITAVSSANARDSYGNVATGYKSVGELIKQGWVTDDSVLSYLNLVLGDGWNSKEVNGQTVSVSSKEAYGSISNRKIKGTNHTLKDYLTTDSQGNITSRGAWTFAEDAVKLGFGTKGEDGLIELDLTKGKIDEIAEALGTSTDMVELFGKALSESGMDVTFESATDKVERLSKKLKEQQEEVKNATSDTEKVQKQQEAAATEKKLTKAKVDAAFEKGYSAKDLLGQDDATLTATLDIDTTQSQEKIDQQLQTAREQIEAVGKESGEIPLTVKIDDDQFASLIGMENAEVKVTPIVESAPEIPPAEVQTTAIVESPPEIPPTTVDVTVNYIPGNQPTDNPKNVEGTATYNVEGLDVKAEDLTGTVEYNADFTGIPRIGPNLTGKIYYQAVMPSGVGQASGTMLNVAHADGTAYNVLNYTRLSPSHAGGKVALDRNEYALTNEVGRESIVRNGVWYMLPPGPHMEHLKKGDIVFSAKQTADLLRAGRTSTYAKALSTGTIAALNAGSAGLSHAYSGFSGSGQNPWASGGYKGNNSGSIGSGSSSGGGGSNSKSKDDKDKIDWIEIAIKRFEALLKKLSNIAENTFNNLITRLNATNENIAATRKDIEFQSKAYDRYIEEANKVGLSEDLAEKVRNGDLDINSYDEKTRKKIEEYQKWYEKAEACAEAIEDLKISLAELYKSKFDNIQKDFENKLSLMEERAAKFDTELKRLEAKGYTANASIYESQRKDKQNRITTLTAQLAEMQKAFDDTMASGFLQEGSEAWYEMMLEIQKVKNEIAETDVEIIELNNSIRELKWDSFDKALESISDLNDEADFLISVLSGEKLTDEAGNLTNEGMAALGLRAQKIDTYMAQSQRYADEITRLDKEIAEDPMNNTLIDRRKELLKLQRESILAAQSEKEAMKDLVSDGINSQLDAIKKLIDAYDESLDSAKDLYDYQKSITEKTKKISDIEKQLAAYQGDTSQETRATIQKLKADLEEANEDLKDAEYDRYISDTKEMLNKFYEDYEETLNSRLDDIDVLVEELINSVNNNASDILSTLRGASSDVGIGLSNEISEIWENSGSAWNAVSSSADKVADRVSSVLEVVTAIYRNTCLISGENATMSFASGGLVDYTGKANVHGTKSKPELMLNAEDTKNFLKLRDALRNLKGISVSPYSALTDMSKIVPDISAKAISPSEVRYVFGDTHITIDHVEDYNDFVRQLQQDPKFEKMVQAMTVGQLSRKRPLDKYSYSWKNK